MDQKLRNDTVDIFRLIASFFIVFLHVGYDNMDENTASIIRLTGRWGVPFFFMLSGYFLQKTLTSDSGKKVTKSCIKLISILICADAIYIIAQYIIEGNFNWKHLFPGAYFHLWFLPSLCLGTLIIYFYKKYNLNLLVTFSISILILCLVLACDSYSEILHIQSLVRSSYVIPLLSIPFMTIGTYFYNVEWLKKLINIKLALIFSAFGFALQIIEVHFISIYTDRESGSHQYLIGTLFFSLGIFILAFALNLKNRHLGAWGRKYSLFIYLFHPLLILIFYQINYQAIFVPNIILLFPTSIFFLTLLIGVILEKYCNNLFLILTGGKVIFSNGKT